LNPLAEKLKGTRIILGSNSPRRQELLHAMGIDFEVMVRPVEEVFPEQFRKEDAAMFLARKKALAFKPDLPEGSLVITADTLVAVDDLVLGKPVDTNDAERMLKLLSGRKHSVVTGVCILSARKSESFFSRTEVAFKTLRVEEIRHYISTGSPMDKAGAYGIQDWIGMTGIEYILGSYYNVVGLPTKELHEQLMRF
jgi:septum formation protein